MSPSRKCSAQVPTRQRVFTFKVKVAMGIFLGVIIALVVFFTSMGEGKKLRTLSPSADPTVATTTITSSTLTTLNPTPSPTLVPSTLAPSASEPPTRTPTTQTPNGQASRTLLYAQNPKDPWFCMGDVYDFVKGRQYFWFPYPNVEVGMLTLDNSEINGGLVQTIVSVDQCQAFCTSVYGCNFFGSNQETGECYLFYSPKPCDKMAAPHVLVDIYQVLEPMQDPFFSRDFFKH
jgi:hypothetical protein